MQDEYRQAVSVFVGAIEKSFGDRLVSVVLFGSVARGTARPDSDVDILVVAADLPPGVRKRLSLAEEALCAAETVLSACRPDGVVSIVIKSPAETEHGGPLFYDMTVAGEAEILFDRNGFMNGFLSRLRAKMSALGSRRLSYLGHPYWDLKPDWKPGDVIDL